MNKSFQDQLNALLNYVKLIKGTQRRLKQKGLVPDLLMQIDVAIKSLEYVYTEVTAIEGHKQSEKEHKEFLVADQQSATINSSAEPEPPELLYDRAIQAYHDYVRALDDQRTAKNKKVYEPIKLKALNYFHTTKDRLSIEACTTLHAKLHDDFGTDENWQPNTLPLLADEESNEDDT